MPDLEGPESETEVVARLINTTAAVAQVYTPVESSDDDLPGLQEDSGDGYEEVEDDEDDEVLVLDSVRLPCAPLQRRICAVSMSMCPTREND